MCIAPAGSGSHRQTCSGVPAPLGLGLRWQRAAVSGSIGPQGLSGEAEAMSNSDRLVSDTESGSSDESGSDEDVASWISWFCSLKGNEFFCEVEEDFIQDDFNLSGLSSQVPYYDYALDLILDADSPSNEILTEEQHELVESAAEMLYGLVHVRYILTSRGMTAICL
ncbi:hypothetical protein WJX72_011311 [[Myrmecia] bisecta]|uniref:Casein kinase II subunit beta n=1 Tax=[Myrmecia] bisecta TaxID=41462 RepID=A0AAW1PU99_9CHLO